MIWKAKHSRDRRRRWSDATQRRTSRPERLEGRRLLAADPIHVGVVYLETDYLESDLDVGGDSRGDRFILSFVGGAPDTELSELRIRTDKDGDGISVGDPLFDTEPGGRGKNGAHSFQVVRVYTSDGRQINTRVEVEDGGQELVLRLSNFRAGDRLEFTIDVDEVLRNAIDLAVFNDRLDVITSGQEFQDSILEATFNAPHYEVSQADAIFLNDYGSPAESNGLNLPDDESDNVDSRPNRSAAAVASTVQVPKPVSIAGNVWVDNDLDQIREFGEARVAAVEIALWKLEPARQAFVDTGHRARTDESGRYVFPKSLGLSPGQYRVVESQPQGWYSVAAVPGTVDGVPSGLVESPDAISTIDLPLGDLSAINYDFAEAQPASLSGYVYLDSDNSGHRDSVETGIAGVRVQLVPINTIAPQSVLTVTTAADGSYSFTGLAPGSYEVIEIDQPAHLNDGLDTAGTVGGRVVGVAENPGDQIREIVLAGNDAGIQYNFGELAFGSLAGFVYLAAPGEDCTGQHDADGNLPLVDVQVALQTEFGETVAQTRTGADGGYFFDALPIGNYRILQFTPNGLIDGDAHVGRIDNVQVGTAVGGGLIQDITMTPSGIGVEYNFCEAAPASISGYVYADGSDDGRRDANEAGIANTTVSLVDTSGSIVATTTTDASGQYEFNRILPGDYTIVESQPSGYFDGIDTPGTVRGRTVGRVADNNDKLTAILLKQGDEAVEYNFGELLAAALSGRVHSDIDGDCQLDDDEQTIAGVRIRLLNEAGVEVATTTTDAAGRYFYNNLAPGKYTIVEEQPAGFIDGDAHAGSAGGVVENGGRIANIVLASGEIAVDYNFCERPPAEIIGSVFSDLDGDCLFDADEPGIAGVQVELYEQSGRLLATTMTGPSGEYRFSNLLAGEYMIREIQPSGWLQGGQSAGSAGGDDSVPDLISRIPVAWGQRLTQYNFCEIEPSSISGVVFVDGNGDCLRDAVEISLEGVTVELRDASGNRVAMTTTDANGRYSFEGLPPGQYEIFELQPDGYFQGGQSVGSGGGSVVGDDRLALTLLAGRDVVDYNFCEIGPGSISGTVYVDDDGDCVRDANESGLEGVTIELRDRAGNRVAQTTTDANGNYQFTGLAPGAYEIFEFQPGGFFQGSQRLGSGGGEVLGQDHLALTLFGGTDVVDYNFCELAPSSIAGRVWQESDLNLKFDSGESPIPGVLVELIDDSGVVAAQTTADSGGRYLFDTLAPGVYSVRETQPSKFFHGGQVVGSQGGQVGADDLLVGIVLTGGTHAIDYDFAEVPPAAISGFVFQDGDPIAVSQRPDPTQLRQFKDGRLTDDDLRLAGVVVELRNILGQPFTAARALPGVYEDGPIRTTTDADGFYQFVGLRPGTYHVYQVQPDDFVDGLDTPGTSGGLAVNPADEVDDPGDKIMIQTLALNEQTDPHDDAILNISLVGGSESALNNFSEVVIVNPPVLQPPPPRPDVLAVYVPPAPVLESYIRVVTFSAASPSYRAPMIVDDEWPVSWHLSLINGGFPRGEVESADVRGVSLRQMQQNWSAGEHTGGRWTIVTRDGKRVPLSQSMTLGEQDAVALTGDFNGDGADEAVLYVGGQWFVDLNGNGRWDPGDLWIQLGTEMDRPVVGDWDGDGKDDIGIFGRQWQRDPQRIKRDPGLPDPDNTRRRTADSRQLAATQEDRGEDRQRLLRRGNKGSLRADAVDHVFQYGQQVDTPVSGDWNGDGIDQIAVFRGGQWLLDVDGDGRWTSRDNAAEFGRSGDEPISGDFNGDGIDEIGVVRGDLWIIDTDGDRRITANDLRIVVPREGGDSQPVVGDFDGDGKDEPGYYDEAA